MKALLAHTPDELRAEFASAGTPAFRAAQVAQWLYGRRVRDFAAMANLPAPLRAELAASWRTRSLALESQHRAADGTRKLVLATGDGAKIEAVLIPEARRQTLCVSSQVGCSLDCAFCATGRLGLGRNLRPDEIVDQALHAAELLAQDGKALSHVVFMGMGEPLLNTERVLAAADALTDARRFGLGARHLTISTSGVVPGLDRLVAADRQYTLAVSLHAARPALRDVLVPLNRRYPIDDVVREATVYAEATGRRVSYEVVMIEGINDTSADAAAIVALLRGRLAHVNLIPMNPVAHTPWQPSRPPRLAAFAAVLRAGGLTTTIRRNRGLEIGAACGQLAAESAGAPSPAAVALRRERLARESAAALRA